MKIVLALAAGVLPLLVATVANFAGVFAAPPVAADFALLAPDVIAEGQTAADTALSRAAADAKLVALLHRLNEFAPDALPPMPPAGASTRWGEVLQQWSLVESAHHSVRQYVAVLSEAPPGENPVAAGETPGAMKARLEQSKTRLAVFKRRLDETLVQISLQPAQGKTWLVDHASGIKRRIDEQLANADDRLREIDAHRSHAAKLELARARFSQNKYAECLAELAGLPVERGAPGGVFREEAAALANEAEELQARAAFWKYWSEWDTLPIAKEKTRDALTAFQARRKDAPAAFGDPERGHLVKMDARIEDLNRQVAIDEFLQEPKTRIGEWAFGAERIARNDPQARLLLRAKFKDWLIARLPEKRAAAKPSLLREALLVKEQRLLSGVFRPGSAPSVTNRDLVWFKYYETPELAQNSPAQYRTVYLSTLTFPPGTPADVRCVQEFNEQRQKLAKAVERRSEWEAFAKLCDRLSREMDEYAALGGQAASLNFEDEVKLAGEVLDEWNQVAQLLAGEPISGF
jgi:hypothetical protein